MTEKNKLKTKTELSNAVRFTNHEIGNYLTGIISLSSLLEQKEMDFESVKLFSKQIASQAWKIQRSSRNLNKICDDTQQSSQEIDIARTISAAIKKIQESHERKDEIKISFKANNKILNDITLNSPYESFMILIEESIYTTLEKGDNIEVVFSYEELSPKLCISFNTYITREDKESQKELNLSALTMDACLEEIMPISKTSNEDEKKFSIKLKIDESFSNLHTIEGSNEETKPLKPLNILIIDDEQLVSSALVKVIKLVFEKDYNLKLITTNGEDIDKVLSDTEMNIVLCDINLRGQNGLDIYKKAIDLYEGYAKKFIFLTGGSLGSEDMEFIDKNGASFIKKPFDMENLVNIIKMKLS